MTEEHITEATEEVTPDNSSEIQESEADNPDDKQTGNPNAEAAKYRRKLRDTEEALTEAQTKVADQDQRITALQRKLIDQHTGPNLHNAEDFWKFADVELGDLLDEDGLPDFDKVDKALNTMLEERSYLKNLRVPKPDPSAGPGKEVPRKDTLEQYLQERLG